MKPPRKPRKLPKDALPISEAEHAAMAHPPPPPEPKPPAPKKDEPKKDEPKK